MAVRLQQAYVVVRWGRFHAPNARACVLLANREALASPGRQGVSASCQPDSRRFVGLLEPDRRVDGVALAYGVGRCRNRFVRARAVAIGDERESGWKDEAPRMLGAEDGVVAIGDERESGWKDASTVIIGSMLTGGDR